MEYVAGLPIAEYCDRERLPIAARLSLFTDVCAGVNHAHQKLIVHRDLKPSNVLVTVVDGRPIPKVIDFGLAKALDDHLGPRTSFTEFGVLVGTPEYMSPEQIDPVQPYVDFRSDVYALGLLLYELLTGGLPFDRTRLRTAGYEEARRIVRDEEPLPPSSRVAAADAAAADIAGRRQTTATALVREIRGDLDRICLKALEKDRRVRYASPAELDADIQRYLAHEPVRARPATLAYRARKYVRRHRTRVAVGAAVGAALMLGFAGSAFLGPRRTGDAGVLPAGRTATVEVLTRTGFAGGPAISPDGRKVAFDENRSPGSKSLWLADVETGTTERLPIPSAPNFQYLQWPRGGGHLYFGTLEESATLTFRRYSLGDRRLETLGSLRVAWLAVSPDERRIAAVRNDKSRGSSILVVANLDGSGEREVAARPISEPYFLLAWSPDGRTIAATTGNLGIVGKPMSVAAIDLTDGRERMLSREKWTRAGAKVWLPDGRGLLMLGQRWGEKQHSDSWLWHVDTSTGETHRISIGPDELAGWGMSLSADGRTLAATRTHLATSLWIAPAADPSLAREIGAAWGEPRFLPDGRLLFTGPDQFLWRINADGSGGLRLTNGVYKAAASDGRTMVFSRLDPESVSQIYRADIDGRNMAQLTYGAASTKPAITPDGKWVVYVTAADGALWKVPLKGGEPVFLASGVVSDPAVSPDSQSIAVSLREGSRWVPGLISINGGGVRRTMPLPPGTSLWHVRFSREGTALDLALTDHRAGNIWRLPLDGGPARQLTHFATDELHSFDWSWDGRFLACVRGGWRGDIVLLRGGW
jgi:Tol biopolymer transport system component